MVAGARKRGKSLYTILGQGNVNTTMNSSPRRKWKYEGIDMSLYDRWRSMRRRCYGTNANGYEYYGGRGIKVCDRWKDSYTDFLNDMGPLPTPKHTVERIDNDGDYTPENCRWATHSEQKLNMRRNHRLTFEGYNLTITEWAAKTGLTRAAIETRIRRGWPVKRALTEGKLR